MSNAFADYVTGNYSTLITDEQILEYMAEWATTIKHPFSTARLDKDPSKGVVDGQLNVKKVRGLRIIDASVWVCDSSTCVLMAVLTLLLYSPPSPLVTLKPLSISLPKGLLMLSKLPTRWEPLS
jgi:hypothetical protein